ncbi:hypothetical protein KOR34_41550 [Posidoniimonas corsicana]|uniref:DUF6036 domain-containing protein n=1 Tax=Posidoniimonas corsicana TaxID=1938618 RepID=A0A5C5V3R3_9BACT|nr:DUF6036 family nucleotidyltransferase [Posidoniimonas corsicana]TWT32392.1 hypothetical protein KOR34_41550 [Posidoniimonas corsicana]
MQLNEDYREMLSALNDAGVEYLIVGAYALAAHGNPRATGDIDLLIRPSRENAERVWKALTAFRAPKSGILVDDFTLEDTVFQIGVAPRRIDLLTSITGVTFDQAWDSRKPIELDGLSVYVLGRKELIANKRAAGRPKDQADAAWLEGCEWD